MQIDESKMTSEKKVDSNAEDAIIVRNPRSPSPMLIMKPTPDGAIDIVVGEGWTMTEACREFLETCKRLQNEAREARKSEA